MQNKEGLCSCVLAHWTIAGGGGGASVNTPAASALSLRSSRRSPAGCVASREQNGSANFYDIVCLFVCFYAFKLKARRADKWLNHFQTF